MNKTAIEWCDMTFNPVTGCRHGCEYCYARRITERFGGYDGYGSEEDMERVESGKYVLDTAPYIKRKNGVCKASFPFGFEPTLHRYRLEEPQHQKKPQNIFVGSMADLFGDWVPDSWIEAVFAACAKAPQHRYMFLTKNPGRYLTLAKAGKLPMQDNMWYGSTVTGPNTPYFVADGCNTFLSIEPLLEPFGQKAEGFSRLGEPRWIILGAMTGPGSDEHQPEKSWVDEITSPANAAEAAIFMKDSLIPVMGKENMRREFPWKTRKAKDTAQTEGGAE